MADSVSGQPQYDAPHVRGYYPAASCHVAQHPDWGGTYLDQYFAANPPAVADVEYHNARTVTSTSMSSGSLGGVINYQGTTVVSRVSSYFYSRTMFDFAFGTETYSIPFNVGLPIMFGTAAGNATGSYHGETFSRQIQRPEQYDNMRFVILLFGAIAYELNLNYVRWAGACYAWQPLQDATGNNAVIELTQATIYEL